MAAHHVAIAKATFAASLLRPDTATNAITREKVNGFHALLDAAIGQCSPRNVQACREWLQQNILPSQARCAALGKYLVVVATPRYGALDDDDDVDGMEHKPSPHQRSGLHALYMINDVLHWCKYHDRTHTMLDMFSLGLGDNLRVLLGLASTLCTDQNGYHKRIKDLMTIWEENDYLSVLQIEQLRKATETGRRSGSFSADNAAQPALAGSASEPSNMGKGLPWIMPAVHGDELTPYYDLPAANMMPHILPDSSRPIDPRRIKPIRFSHGPADEVLIKAVQALLHDVDLLYDDTQNHESANHDIDPMGETLLFDEMDERIDSGTYYGWSRSFAVKMQKRQQANHLSRGRNRSGSRSRSSSSGRSISRSRSPRKRRRYSSSASFTPSPRCRPERYRSSSASQSSERHHHVQSQSPERPQPARQRDQDEMRHAPSLPRTAAFSAPPPPPPPPQPMNMNMMNNGMPIPPPRPLNWLGTWPPPPPLLPPSMSYLPQQSTAYISPMLPHFPPGIQPFPAAMVHLPPPPPPPPPPSPHAYWNNAGRPGHASSRGGEHGR